MTKPINYVWVVELEVENDIRDIYKIFDNEELARACYKSCQEDKYSADPILTRWILNSEKFGADKQVLPEPEPDEWTPT